MIKQLLKKRLKKSKSKKYKQLHSDLISCLDTPKISIEYHRRRFTFVYSIYSYYGCINLQKSIAFNITRKSDYRIFKYYYKSYGVKGALQTMFRVQSMVRVDKKGQSKMYFDDSFINNFDKALNYLRKK